MNEQAFEAARRAAANSNKWQPSTLVRSRLLLYGGAGISWRRSERCTLARAVQFRTSGLLRVRFELEHFEAAVVRTGATNNTQEL